MTALSDRLFFTPPLMPIDQAYHVLRLVAQVSNSAQLFHILESQRDFFTHYSALLILLKETYGFTEEENPFKKARVASQTYAQEEKIFASAGQEEKENGRFVQKTFKGRILYHRAFKSEDG